jgi:hypothetical protein
MFARRHSSRFVSLVAAGLMAVLPAAARAQDKVVTPALDFSGVMLMNFRSASDSASKAANGGNSASKFDIERIYLNFRMPAGDDGSIRVTADVFNGAQDATSYYKGWTARLKYAWFQYNFLHDIGGNKGFNAVARVGMLHTSLIDHQENFWPRYLSQVGTERNGFFSSADVGAAVVVTLPNKFGEIYGEVANGTGYGSAEADRFKDFSGRVTLTPFANESGFLKTFTISPWAYIGQTASKFQNGGTGQVGTVSDGLTRNRMGVFVGLRDRRLTVGGEFAQRTETVETGANTNASPRGTYDNSGKLTSGFILVRPFELFEPKVKSPFGLLARVDNFKPYSQAAAATGTQTTSAANQLFIGGLFYDLNQKATVALDFQNLSRQSGSTAVESKAVFLHFNVGF